MTPHLDPALAIELAHQRRRHQPLPPRDVMEPDEALRIVRAEEARRAGEKLNAIIEAARSV